MLFQFLLHATEENYWNVGSFIILFGVNKIYIISYFSRRLIYLYFQAKKYVEHLNIRTFEHSNIQVNQEMFEHSSQIFFFKTFEQLNEIW